mgnify:CR=1 FL=1
MPKKEVLEKLITKTKVYLLLIAVLLIMLCCYNSKLIIPAIITFVLVVAYAVWSNGKNKVEVIKHLQEATTDTNSVVKNTLINAPFPIIIMKNSGEVVWKSSKFLEEFANVPIKNYLSTILKEMKNEFDNTKTSRISAEYNIDKKHYNIICEYIKNKQTRKKDEYYIVLYIMENTDYINMLNKYEAEQTCVGIITIDNYEELIQRISVEEKPQVIAEVEKTIYEWTALTEGLVVKNERETYVLVFERKFMGELEKNKFSILDDIKKITVSNNLQLTLSISISTEGENTNEKYKSAMAGLELALGRGGDQVVVRNQNQYKFYGGRAQEIEKRTKVKARIIAQSLEELIKQSSNVMVIGHKNSDMDSIGSALGIYRFAKSLEKDVYIVNTTYSVAVENLIAEVEKDDEYKDVIINENEVLSLVDENTLLVVVDTNKISYTEMPSLFEKTNKVVVIDHHRKGTEFIENPVLMFHEVYASSASELVVEILQYADIELKLKSLEAEALYAGIMTDTKNFTFKTGVRTFEAAAYLRKLGVDIIRVKKWFQSDLRDYNLIADIVKNAEIIKDNIAIAVNTIKSKDISVVCAKAADELLTISTITASFVIGDTGEKILISGRSIGDINVQVILEKMGGGGHMTTAGTQIEGKTIEEVKSELIEKINEYFEDLN